jgi:hypothetical protein
MFVGQSYVFHWVFFHFYTLNHFDPTDYAILPSGYLTVRHGSHGPFIDGLPINSMVIFHGYVK